MFFWGVTDDFGMLAYGNTATIIPPQLPIFMPDEDLSWYVKQMEGK